MIGKKILSEDFQNLNKISNEKKEAYLNAKPFPNITLNNFFKDDFLNIILDEFPDLSKLNESQNYNVQNEIKLSNNNYKKFSKNIKLFIDYLNSEDFINFLQDLTSIKEKLVSDPDLQGGGLHEIKRGGVLKIHTDFNRHSSFYLDRRINVLIYLNKNWKDSYGGHLEFWNKDVSKCKKKVLPSFNTMAIFSTTDFSNHGHPEPLNCPKNISRKSIALYYFSSGRPKNEIINVHKKNKTYFKSRAGIKNDANEKKENFKDFLRSFKLYQSIKNFEKKYIRRGKNNLKK